MDRNHLACALALSGAVLLSACGGSDGGDTAGFTVNAGGDRTALAFAETPLTGTVTGGAETLQTHWEKIAGPDVTLKQADRLAASFQSGAVDKPVSVTFRLTVSNASGETRSDEVTYRIRPSMLLKGRVFDGPIDDATVAVSLGEEEFTATSDGNGEYELRIPADAPAEFIEIHAQRDDGVALKHYAGTVEALAARAASETTGSDEQIVIDDAAVTNVTNVTTSKAVGMEEKQLLLDDQGIADMQALEAMERAVDPADALNRAVAIKLVIDHDQPLPDGIADTLELIEDRAALDAFVQQVNVLNPALYDEVVDEIIADQAGMIGYAQDELAETLYAYVPGNYNNNDAFVFDFDDVTSGRLLNGSSDEGFNWTLTEGEVHIDVVTPQINDGPVLVPGAGTVRALEYRDSITLSRLVDGEFSDIIAVTETRIAEYPDNPELETATSTRRFYLSTLSPETIVPFQGSEFAEPVTLMLECCEINVVDALTIQPDGSGVRERDDMPFGWLIDAGALEISFSDTRVVRVIRTRELFGANGKAHEAVTIRDLDGDDLDGAGDDLRYAGETVLAIRNDAAFDESLANEVLLELGGEAAHQGDQLAHQLEFLADGMANRRLLQMFTGTPVDLPAQPFTWEITDGKLITRDCWDEQDGEPVFRVVHADPPEMPGECRRLFRKITHELVADSGDYLYLHRALEIHEDLEPDDGEAGHQSELQQMYFLKRAGE